jgi:outer membrane protein TolC
VGVAFACLLAVAGVSRAGENPRLTLPEIVRLALASGQQGALSRSRLTEQGAQGAVNLAQGAFDWNADVSGGYRRVALSQDSGGFLTNDIRFANVMTTTVAAEKLFENGIRVRPGFVASSGDSQSRLASVLLRSQPVLEVEVPVDARFGQPVEGLRLKSARADLDATRLEGRHARQHYLNRVMKSAWAFLAAQRKYAASLSQAAVAEEVAGRVLRLAAAREVSSMSADEVLDRAELRRNGVNQAELDMSAARIDLASLLRVEETTLTNLDASFPVLNGTLDEARLQHLLVDAMERRLDLRGETQRIESARQRADIARRQADSRLTLQAGHDRLLLNWSKPLGANRDLGSREQAVAEVGLATLQADDLRRAIEVDVRVARKRLLAAGQILDRLRPVVERHQQRLALVRQLVEQGRQPATALLDAADQLSHVQRQLADLERSQAEALADLHLATASIPDSLNEPAMLVSAFTRLP